MNPVSSSSDRFREESMDGEATPTLQWWVVPAAVVLCLALLALFVGKPPRMAPSGSTLDATPHGVRAAYLLLEGLGCDVATSRRVAVGRVRWVLFPSKGIEEADVLNSWVRDGGTLLLADDKEDFAQRLGLPIEVQTGIDEPLIVDEQPRRLRVTGGSVRISPQVPPDDTWPDADAPLAGIYRRGRGEIWLVNRPLFLRNDHIRDADNALVLTRLADAVGEGTKIYFDEYFHGLRDRPGPVELLLEPPALWVTLQGVVLLLLVLWRFVPRFGVLREPPAPRRRSKEEYLEAMAHLLERKRAYNEAFRSVRDALARELEHALVLPAGTPPEALAGQAARRVPGLDAGRLARALARDGPPPAAAGFLGAVHELESLRREFFHERDPR
jgi:hypothetical protein